MDRTRKYAALAGSGVRYASQTTGVNFEKLLTWGAVLGVAYLGLKAYSAVSGAVDTVKGALNSVGSALGSGLYDLFHPGSVGEMLYYTVRGTDGKNWSVPSGTVDKSGRFTWKDGRRYQILTDKEKKTGVNKVAVPV